MLRIRLTTTRDEYQVEMGVMMLPEASGHTELQGLLRHVLGDDCPMMVFRLGGRIIRDRLDGMLAELGLSKEDVYEVIYDLPEEEPKLEQSIVHPEWIRSISMGQTGILTGSYDRLIRLYQGDLSPKVFKSCQDTITIVTWIDRRRFVAGCADGMAYIWDVENTDQPEQLLKGCSGAVQSVHIHEDQIFIADYDGNICIFSTDTNAGRPPTLKKDIKIKSRYSNRHSTTTHIPVQTAPSRKIHEGAIAKIIKHSDHLYSFGWDRMIKKWLLPHLDSMESWKCPESISAATIIDTGTIVTAHSDGSLRCWDHVSMESLGSQLVAHCGWISEIMVDPLSNNRLVTCGYDGAVQIWDQRDLSTPTCTLKDATTGTKVLCLDWRDDELACGGEDRTLSLYRT